MSADFLARGLAVGLAHQAGVAFDNVGLKSSSGALRASIDGGRLTYHSSEFNFTPAATATDIAALVPQAYGRTLLIESITITGTATAASVLDVLIQRSVNGGAGTSAAKNTSKANLGSRNSSAALYIYSANRTSNGDGVSSTRPVAKAGKLFLGTAAVPAPALVFQFSGPTRPILRGLTEWLVINLAGQAIPAGCSLDISIEWSEETVPPLIFGGDSTTSNASTMFDEFGGSGALLSLCNILNAGSNGFRLEDALLNTNGITYPLVGTGGILDRLGGLPSVLALCFGLNDLRTGAGTRAYMIDMLDAAIYATLNGTTNAGTYTATKTGGAGTQFTWPATIAANPDCRIILHGPNSLTTDGNGSNYVTLTGRFSSGYTVAQAAQVITDDLYAAYEAFRGDPRVFAVVQQQDIFGRTCATVANSGAAAYAAGYQKANLPLMTDILHPNARGQKLKARQIGPILLRALAECQSEYL
jgi:hypothetical protein